jgi:T-complex protein 1 subunit delta
MFYIFFYRGTVEDTELIDGLVFPQKTTGAGGVNKVEKAKVGLIQFCISPPKTDVSVKKKRNLSSF